MNESAFINLVNSARNAGSRQIIVTLHRRMSADLLTPVSTLLRLREDSRFCFLFESVEGGEKLARYSFLGRNPYRVYKAFGEFTFRTDFENGASIPGPAVDVGKDIFHVLEDEIKEYTQLHSPDLPRFTGGAVGYFSYDAIRLIENVPDSNEDMLELPDAVVGMYDSIVAFDHVKHQLVLMQSVFVDGDADLSALFAEGCSRLDELGELLRNVAVPTPAKIELAGTPTASFNEQEFCDAVEKAKKHIHDGDIFQVVLSRRTSIPYSGDAVNLYRAVRQINPSPYLFYYRFDESALIGSSPELLVRVDRSTVETLPIAGTRSRGKTREEDLRLERDLRNDPKETAEHLMLVDLGRNDIGRVCKPGTVEVRRFSEVERFSHVMHLVSSVSGVLADKQSAVDALKAVFPAGTVTGAPKVRAMQIIDDLEPIKRGPYAGAVGYLDYSGNMDTCISIRTVVVHDGSFHVQAGAGIVADSNPAAEFQETENKAMALLEAVQTASLGI